MNLVSLIMQFLGPTIVSKLASSLGLNQGLAQKAIAAALPAILAGLAGKANQSGGAGALFDILSKQDPGLLGKLVNVIGGAQQKQIADQGNTVLGSLLGNSPLGALTGALSKYAGIGEAPTKGLIGMLAPVVLGSLAQQQKSASLDAGGLAKLLADQKDNIKSALPADFAKLLGPSGLLDSITTKPAEPKPVAAAAAPAASATPRSAPSSPASTGSTMPRTPARSSEFNWWPWLIVIGLAMAAWWWMFQGRPQPQMMSGPSVPRAMAGSNDVGSQLDTTLRSLQSVLAGVKDGASAQAAVSKLQDSQTSLDKLGSVVDSLPPDAKRAIAGYVAQWLPTLTPMITQLLANTAVAPLVKPALEAIRTRLEAMAKA